MMALIPGLGLELMTCNPKKANTLFSPVMGTISAAMAADTKSKYGIKSSVVWFRF
jgi:hypothetical protein